MPRKKEKICRLCLEIVIGDCELIEEIISEILEVLLLKVDLSISKEPVICGNCKDSMQKAFDFKSNCLSVEEFIVSTSRSADTDKLDIRDICLDGNQSIGMTVNEDCGICRFCMQCSEFSNFVSLKSLRKTIDEDVLLKCVPELDLTVIKAPVVCTSCKDSLESYFKFATKCWLAKSNIDKYCQAKGTGSNGQIELNDLLNYFTSSNMTLAIKQEDAFENANPSSPGINGSLIKTEVLYIKDEDVEMDNASGDKLQDELSCSFSKTKESKHMVGHTKHCTSRTTFECHLCTFKTKYKFCIKEHMLSHTDSPDGYPFKCNNCTFKTKYKRALQHHMLVHLDGSVYKCEICRYTTKRPTDLKRHSMNHKDRSEVPLYKCKSCIFETRHKSNLNRHARSHREVPTKMYQCEMCYFQTVGERQLKRHMKAVHKDCSLVVTYKCDECTFTSKSRQGMRTHKKYSEVIMYKCDLCEMETEHQIILKHHMRMHKRSSNLVKVEPQESKD